MSKEIVYAVVASVIVGLGLAVYDHNREVIPAAYYWYEPLN